MLICPLLIEEEISHKLNMYSFIKTNKNLVTYSLICLLIIPIFGFNFLISFIGNILILLILIPILVLLIIFISFNSFKSKINVCNQCGTITFGSSNTCTECGAGLEDSPGNKNNSVTKPSETTIEVKAEEIK